MNRTFVAAAALLLAAQPALAQDGYMFRRPSGQVTLSAGPNAALARSELFDFLTSELSLSRGDFTAPAFSVTVAVLEGERFDVGFSLGWSQVRASSEFRDWVGADDLPIAQTTRLQTVPLSGTLRYRLLPRGRQISRLAWVPARTVPYVGGGIGATWYSLRQNGEFLNTDRCERDPAGGCAIFPADLSSSGEALTVHAVAGVERWLSTRVGLTLEGRYTRGSAPLTWQFQSYDRIDLSGVSAAVGLSLRW